MKGSPSKALSSFPMEYMTNSKANSSYVEQHLSYCLTDQFNSMYLMPEADKKAVNIVNKKDKKVKKLFELTCLKKGTLARNIESYKIQPSSES